MAGDLFWCLGCGKRVEYTRERDGGKDFSPCCDADCCGCPECVEAFLEIERMERESPDGFLFPTTIEQVAIEEARQAENI